MDIVLCNKNLTEQASYASIYHARRPAPPTSLRPSSTGLVRLVALAVNAAVASAPPLRYTPHRPSSFALQVALASSSTIYGEEVSRWHSSCLASYKAPNLSPLTALYLPVPLDLITVVEIAVLVS